MKKRIFDFHQIKVGDKLTILRMTKTPLISNSDVVKFINNDSLDLKSFKLKLNNYCLTKEHFLFLSSLNFNDYRLYYTNDIPEHVLNYINQIKLNSLLNEKKEYSI